MRALVLLFLVFSVGNAAARHHCHHGWTPFGVQCYKFFSESVNWVRAEKNCQSVDANLASVRSSVENSFILSLVPGDTRAWIGGHDAEIEGQWLWTDGSPYVFTNWCSPQPDNDHAGGENCLEINISAVRCWNDASCSIPMGYICAKLLKS